MADTPAQAPATEAPDHDQVNMYYQQYHATPREFHVDPEPTSSGRYLVLNALNLTVCVHTTYTAAVRCAHGGYCTTGRRA